MNLPQPVDISTIDTNFDTPKLTSMLLVTCGDKLLLQNVEQLGLQTCDTWGTFIDSVETANDRLMIVQDEHFGTAYPLTPAGTVVTYMNKPAPDKRVQLTICLYRLELTEEQAKTLNLPDNYIWFDADAIMADSVIREDGKLMFTYALKREDFNLVLEVQQMKLWTDAKLSAWAFAS